MHVRKLQGERLDLLKCPLQYLLYFVKISAQDKALFLDYHVIIIGVILNLYEPWN